MPCLRLFVAFLSAVLLKLLGGQAHSLPILYVCVSFWSPQIPCLRQFATFLSAVLFEIVAYSLQNISPLLQIEDYEPREKVVYVNVYLMCHSLSCFAF